jgi:hypothetical protein
MAAEIKASQVTATSGGAADSMGMADSAAPTVGPTISARSEILSCLLHQHLRSLSEFTRPGARYGRALLRGARERRRRPVSGALRGRHHQWGLRSLDGVLEEFYTTR